jgi:hypothetical protein
MAGSLEQLDDDELLALAGRDAEAFGCSTRVTISELCGRRTGLSCATVRIS